MANIFPDEGISYLFELFPLNTKSPPATLEIGLFDSHSPASVPDDEAILGGVGVSEMTGDGYVRKTISASGWDSPVEVAGGLTLTATSAIEFGPSTGGDWLAANGFFIAIPVLNIAIYYSNFDGGVARTVSQLSKIMLTPTMRFGN